MTAYAAQSPVLERDIIRVKASSPTYVTKDDPPIMLINGALDIRVSARQAELLDAILSEVGVPFDHVALWDENEVW